MRSIVRYVMERIKWELAGKPMRTPERVHELYHQVCKPCPNFGGDRCNVCGCYISDHLNNPSFNKLAWSTTHCPLPEPKWIEEEKADVDLQKAEQLAEKEVAQMEEPSQVKVTVAQRKPEPTGCCGTR